MSELDRYQLLVRGEDVVVMHVGCGQVVATVEDVEEAVRDAGNHDEDCF